MFGTCLVQGEPVDDVVEIACQVDDPWVFVGDEYLIDQNVLRQIHVDELLFEAVPLGVSTDLYRPSEWRGRHRTVLNPEP